MVYVDPTLFKDAFPVINPYKTLMQSFKELEIKLTGAMDGMLYNMIHTLYRKEGSSLLDLVRFVDDEQNADLVRLGSQTDNFVISDYFKHKFMQP